MVTVSSSDNYSFVLHQCFVVLLDVLKFYNMVNCSDGEMKSKFSSSLMI